MGGDYPDWTGLAQVIGTDIMVAIDVQGGYIMLPVDIQAQYIDLDINIKSQTANINIDVEAQSVGIFLQADWTALQGTDKNLKASDGEKGFGYGAVILYRVTGGKTLYICGFSCQINAHAAADYDHHLYFDCGICDYGGGEPYIVTGGLGGTAVVLNKPFVYTPAIDFQAFVHNWSNISCDVWIIAWGYEI